MSRVLFITANPKSPDASYSQRLSHEFKMEYQKHNQESEIIELDLYRTHVPEIDEDVLNAWGKLNRGGTFEDLNDSEKEKTAGLNAMTDLFLSADKYVFVTPLWNLSLPPRAKAFIDAIMIAGKTFRYTENGPVGLLQNKKAVHIQARGGFYSEGPAAQMEFGDRYLRSILNFIGIADVQTVFVEGMAYAPDRAEEFMENATAHAKEVARWFAEDETSEEKSA